MLFFGSRRAFGHTNLIGGTRNRKDETFIVGRGPTQMVGEWCSKRAW
jgi:hypothetical protein